MNNHLLRPNHLFSIPLLLALVLTLACGVAATPTPMPTATPSPTAAPTKAAPVPTATAAPAPIPAPTATAAPTPTPTKAAAAATPTAVPPATPAPTATPVPPPVPQPTANAVSDWSLIANIVMFDISARPGQAGLVELAYVHVAIYDAINAIDGRYSVFASAPTSSATGASPEAATAAAASTVLRALYPTPQALAYVDSAYSAYLSSIQDGTAKTKGIAIGNEVATAFLTKRAGDGRNASVPYTFGSGPGVYQITPGAPPAPATPLVPWLGQMKTLAVDSASQFRPAGPPSLTSAQWAQEFNEVKEYGALNGSSRTPQQTEIGQFYLEHPGRQLNRNIRDIATAQGLSVPDSARFSAQTYVIIADSMITCFNSKYHYNFWRPVTAIRAADTDGNDATQPDAAWLPFANTPNHPEYPAAHGCVTGSLAQSVERFFGTDKINVTLTSTAVPGVPLAKHTFASTRDMAKEVTDARVYGGMHYRTAGVHGTVIAEKVAAWVSERYFRPVP